MVAELVEKEEDRVIRRKIADLQVDSVSQGGTTAEGGSCRASYSYSASCRS